jgi:hypothetical protein
MRCFAALGIQQNNAAPMLVDDSPLLDLLDGPKTPDADIEVVQAAVSYAGGLGGALDLAHAGGATAGMTI